MKNLLKLFIVLTYATSLQAGGKYVPEQQKDERQNTQQTLPHRARRERRAAKSLRHRRSGREIQAQDPGQPLHKAKNLVRRPQKRALGATEVYSKEHRDAPAFTAERCLWGGLEKELLEDFDAGEALKLYQKTKRFDANLGFFTENSIAEYRKDGKPSYKEFISVRTGKKETTFEK